MKRYHHPSKPEKLSKNAIKRRLRKALDAIEPISREKCNLELKLAATKGSLHLATQEIKKLTEHLEKVTEKVWSHFRVYDQSPERSTIETWRFSGSAQISFGVDFSDVRMMAMADKDAYLSLIADQFAAKARDCAIRNLKIISQ